MDTDKGYYNILRSVLINVKIGKGCFPHIEESEDISKHLCRQNLMEHTYDYVELDSGKWSRLEAHHSFASSHQMHVKSL